MMEWFDRLQMTPEEGKKIAVIFKDGHARWGRLIGFDFIVDQSDEFFSFTEVAKWRYA